VFLIVIRKSKTAHIENHPNIKGWLFAIAKNVARKFNAAYMKAKGQSADIDIELSEDDFTEQLLEDIIYDETNQEKLLDDMRSELTVNEREIFELRLKKLSNKEIAEVLNKSESTVKSTYSRLKPKLKKIIDLEVN
jgi:RNA polymerase sigma factor (sigma-70 family)